jgi:hypothetical protein
VNINVKVLEGKKEAQKIRFMLLDLLENKLDL